MELYLIRHTQPDVAPGICYGQMDLQVAEDLEQASYRIGEHLAGHSALQVYSSPLSRCAALARTLSRKAPWCDPRLMEIDFGQWEGMAWEAIDRELLDNWARDLLHFAPPQGESLYQLSERVLDFFHELKKAEQTVALVTHAGVIRVLLCHLMKMPLTSLLQWQIDYGSVTCLSVTEDSVSLRYSNQR